MSSNIEIRSIQPNEYYDLSMMVGELLTEIMERIDHKAFNFDRLETEKRVNDLISNGKYWVFVARDMQSNKTVGFVSLYESYALYAEGAYGTMPELYVKERWRSKSVGQKLLNKVTDFAKEKGWHRIEVTTPPLPEFESTLGFYQNNGFEITGGRKLKADIQA
ncbi:GNAT family N-acetyltransferase [Thiomicrorhabdus arctica]|uniref:GNAT family N-acetyltransferase n=1 Tax=Thiomicrorhabdus arctica TaxID=131540 RepID=UPI00039EE341|nr:GNAT family N-acetyltransferase [Thiomicrorhabdus arctica]